MGRLTQPDRLLAVLREARLHGDGWVSGRYMHQVMMLSQKGRVIDDLKTKRGIAIETSTFEDEFGFKSYRLAEGPKGVQRFTADMGPNQPPKVIERVMWG